MRRCAGCRRDSRRSTRRRVGPRSRRSISCGRCCSRCCMRCAVERMLMEQPQYNLLFRWFVGLGPDDAVWVPTTFTKNRDRLLEGDIAPAFFEEVMEQARGRRLLSAEHFTVDGTLLEAWAGQKSFKRKDHPQEPPDDPGNPTINFHGERRSNQTHQSTTDPDSRLFKKAKRHEATLGYLGQGR